MIRKHKKRPARAVALARPENQTTHTELECLKRKMALSQIKTDRRSIRQIRTDNIKKSKHPIDRAEAETIASRYFLKNGSNWIRSVGWLVGQGYSDSQYYYKKELPAQIEAHEIKAKTESGGIDVAAIIAAELSDDDPDLSV
jgi:hypothetical protein